MSCQLSIVLLERESNYTVGAKLTSELHAQLNAQCPPVSNRAFGVLPLHSAANNSSTLAQPGTGLRPEGVRTALGRLYSSKVAMQCSRP